MSNLDFNLMNDSETTPLLFENPAFAGYDKPQSLIGKIWMESRELDNAGLADLEEGQTSLSPNQYKPLSIFYFKKALKLMALTYPGYFKRVYLAFPYPFILTIVCSIVSGVVPTFTAWIGSRMLDEVQKSLLTGEPDVKTIQLLAILVISVSFGKIGFNYVNRLSSSKLNRGIRSQTSCEIFSFRLALDMPGLQEPYRRDILEAAGIFAGEKSAIDRKGNNATAGAYKLVDGISKILTAFVTFFSSFILLFSTILARSGDRKDVIIQSILVTTAMLPSAVSLLSSMTTDSKSRSYNHILHRRKWCLNDMSRFEDRKEVTIFSLRPWLERQYKIVNDAIIGERPVMGNWRWIERISNSAGTVGVRTLFQVLLALQIFPSSITLGSAQLLQSIASQFITSIRELHDVAEEQYQVVFYLTAFEEAGKLSPMLFASDGDGERLAESKVLKYKTTKGPDGSHGMKIEARNLSFKYPGTKDYALKNINLTIWPGQTVAIVGFNGGGKTTFVQILLRLYDYEGELLINDIDARRYNPADLHSHMAASFQDFSKLPVSLRENIAVGNMEKRDDEHALMNAVRAGGVDTFLDRLPLGLNTNLNKNPVAARNSSSKLTKYEIDHPEVSLSGGEWRKVALSRAMFRTQIADLCVFDEPSDSLDARSAHNVFNKIAEIAKNEVGEKVKTTIFITHQFATVKRADAIAVFDKGTVVEFGTHDVLMKIAGGVYNEFYSLQSVAFNE